VQIQLNRYAGKEPALIAAGLPEGADALVFARAIQQRGGRGLFVARDDSRASAFMSACRFFAPHIAVISLPAWDCLPYDRVSPSRTLSARRAAALHGLLIAPTNKPLIVVTTVSAAIQKVPPRSIIKTAGFQAVSGQELKREVLEAYLSSNGYSRASTVMEPGDYAIRGGLIDVYPPSLDDPIRLDFFGDELESIRVFDVETQRTLKPLKQVHLAPVSEVLMSDLAVGTFRKNYIASFGGGVSKDPIYAAVIEGIRPQGIEHYLPLFYPNLETIFDYAGPETLIALDGLLTESRSERLDLIEDFYTSRQEYAASKDTGSGDPAKMAGVFRPLPMDSFYIDHAAWSEITGPYQIRDHTPFIPPDTQNKVDFGGKLGRSFSNERRTEGANVFTAVTDYVQSLKNNKKRILIAAWTEGSSERLGSVLSDHGLIASQELRGPEALKTPIGSIRRIILPIEQGFNFGDTVIISEQDILGDRLVNRGRKRKAKNFISEASALKPSDLIVHIDHGLGRYLGLKTLQVQTAPHDCLELEYHGGAKLYLPVENIELLSRYGSAGERAVLDRLGGVAWQSRKAKAKKRLRDMAGELIKIAAKRAMRSCEPTVIEAGPYNEFCARFPYAETDDQLHAIEDVYTDLKSGKPMDRLICGDVGFGKTEVALRAAFAVAMSGKQVAIIAPTTILSRQHFKTFSERFRGWPVTVRQISRLVSPKQASLTREMLANGRCEIVVGTHALLAKSVQFKDLGMIIVDEEQRFGVRRYACLNPDGYAHSTYPANGALGHS